MTERPKGPMIHVPVRPKTGRTGRARRRHIEMRDRHSQILERLLERGRCNLDNKRTSASRDEYEILAAAGRLFSPRRNLLPAKWTNAIWTRWFLPGTAMHRERRSRGSTVAISTAEQ